MSKAISGIYTAQDHHYFEVKSLATAFPICFVGLFVLNYFYFFHFRAHKGGNRKQQWEKNISATLDNATAKCSLVCNPE